MRNPFKFGAVYAGPEQMRNIKKDYDMREVYAGPEEMSETADRYSVEAIYACPMEVSEEEEKSDNGLSYPMNNAEPVNDFNGVYAAPKVSAINNASVAMMVYAGPDYFNADPSPATVKTSYCKCGEKYEDGAKFCTKCGAKRKTVCDCGAEFSDGAKFCSRCGAKRKDI